MSDEKKIIQLNSLPGPQPQQAEKAPRQLKPYPPGELNKYALILVMSKEPGDALVTEIEARGIRGALACALAGLAITPETPIGIVIERRK
jgi:hypothetical protein